MNSPKETSPSFAERSYRRLLRLYPAEFRSRYEEELIQVFSDLWRASAGESVLARACLWTRVVFDVFRTSSKERIAALSAGNLAVVSLVLALVAISVGIKAIPVGYKQELVFAALVLVSGLILNAVRRVTVCLCAAALMLPLSMLIVSHWQLAPVYLAPPPLENLQPATEGLNGEAIYQRVLQTYASSQTYSDEGEVQTRYFRHGKESGYPRIQPFSTAFDRAQGLRLEAKSRSDALDKWDQFVIWIHDGTYKAWWTITQQVEEERSVSELLERGSMRSAKVSVVVPSLLFSVKCTNSLTALTAVKLEGVQTIDGSVCYKVSGSRRFGDRSELWIDERSFLIVKSFQFSQRSEAFAVETLTNFRPQINTPVTEAALALNPAPAPGPWSAAIRRNALFFTMACLVVVVQWVTRIHKIVTRKKEVARLPSLRLVVLGLFFVASIVVGFWFSGVQFSQLVANTILITPAFQVALALHRWMKDEDSDQTTLRGDAGLIS